MMMMMMMKSKVILQWYGAVDHKHDKPLDYRLTKSRLPFITALQLRHV